MKFTQPNSTTGMKKCALEENDLNWLLSKLSVQIRLSVQMQRYYETANESTLSDCL